MVTLVTMVTSMLGSGGASVICEGHKNTRMFSVLESQLRYKGAMLIVSVQVECNRTGS